MANKLKSVMVDAKTVRETAIANATQILEEAFTPTIRDIVNRSLNEEEDIEDLEGVEDMEDVDINEETEEVEVFDDEVNVTDDISGNEMKESSRRIKTEQNGEEGEEDEELVDLMNELDGDVEDVVFDDEDEDVDLNEIIRMLKEEDDEEYEVEDEDEVSSEDLEEVVKFLREIESEDSEEKEEEEEVPVEESTKASVSRLVKENKKLKRELADVNNALDYVKKELSEVNLLNAKMLYSTKIFNKHNLPNKAKMRVIEAFDRSTTMREVKLVYTTIRESLRSVPTSSNPLKESYASKVTNSTKPSAKVAQSREIINENAAVARLQQLANIRK